ncbi:hypothetical protein [Nocardioides bigeumensis]|uniref:GDT1 family protein n=1 Tax=Nocardioides bigeumensis TaxID=433657 RepID=A0ABP5KED5_9ACTN
MVAALVAAAAWQLTLAIGGAALGRFVTGLRGRPLTGVVLALVVAGLAFHRMLA